MDKVLLQMLIAFTLLLEKTMSAELDRLNNALSSVTAQVDQIEVKVQELITAVHNGTGVPAADVENASAQLENLAQRIANINSAQV